MTATIDNPTSHTAPDAQVQPAGGAGEHGTQIGSDHHNYSSAVFPSLHDPTLNLAADVVDDLERVRIANENRYRQLTRTGEDEDGIERGFGLTPEHPEVARLGAIIEAMKTAEKDAVKNLEHAMRNHPLGPWVKAQKGVGDKQAARLLATIGDPAVRTTVAEDGTVTHEWRTVSQLWAYLGLHTLPASHGARDTHVPAAGGVTPPGTHEAARRRKGVKANWSTLGKTRCWNVIGSCMKAVDRDCETIDGIKQHRDDCTCSPYRVVIDHRREHTATTHPDWTPGHSLADAQRVAMKALVRDLWREARRIHGVTYH